MKQETYDLFSAMPQKFWWRRSRAHFLDCVLKKLSLSEGVKILDLGCGTGNLHETLSGYGRVISVDLEMSALSHAKALGIDSLVCSSCEMPAFKPNSFDIVLLMDVLEHVQEDCACFARIVEVVRPGGYLLITTPALQLLWGDDDELVGHCRRYTPSRLRKCVGNNVVVLWIRFRYFFLFFPSAALFLCRRVLRSVLALFGYRLPLRNSLTTPVGVLNGLLLALMKIENKLISRGWRFPFGVGLAALIKKAEV